MKVRTYLSRGGKKRAKIRKRGMKIIETIIK